MNRRDFIKALTVGGLSLSMSELAPARGEDAPQVAITMDDFNWGDTVRMTAEERNRALLSALREHSRLKIALFVAGKYVDNEKGKRLLRDWDRAGHIIANHSYSHLYYNSARTSFDTYSQDILRGEAVLKDFEHFKKLYRFPFLKEGNTLEKRDKLRAFLKERGYKIGHVTIDASDWYVDDRMQKRLKAERAADLSPYRDYYLKHIWERATFYDGLSRKVLGRSVRHTLLVHYNLLNALFLGDLLRMFESKGWRVIDAGRAFEDPVFASAPNIMPAGESIIWALAKETGRFDELLRYPGEDGDYEKEQMDRLGL
ncbi:MAG TPA: polysaccharide deacetylase family protein [Pyrinomonadaceae bacterium]|jgi:peptidoglycan/xylan/chitin deacetylase (PgdA/CDA1 family)|nr:polysaccharide deacetylase family protein [Pyrinomonadaceae bacterium]